MRVSQSPGECFGDIVVHALVESFGAREKVLDFRNRTLDRREEGRIH